MKLFKSSNTFVSREQPYDRGRPSGTSSSQAEASPSRGGMSRDEIDRKLDDLYAEVEEVKRLRTIAAHEVLESFKGEGFAEWQKAKLEEDTLRSRERSLFREIRRLKSR
jgi:hypothetical protein